MSGFNSKQFKGKRVHARRNAAHGCMLRTTPHKEVLSSLLPQPLETPKAISHSTDKGTILTSCLGQREPLFLQSEGVTEVKTKGSLAARKGEVSTNSYSTIELISLTPSPEGIQRHVRIYSYKQSTCTYICTYIHTYVAKRRSRQKFETMNRIAVNRE